MCVCVCVFSAWHTLKSASGRSRWHTVTVQLYRSEPNESRVHPSIRPAMSHRGKRTHSRSDLLFAWPSSALSLASGYSRGNKWFSPGLDHVWSISRALRVSAAHQMMRVHGSSSGTSGITHAPAEWEQLKMILRWTGRGNFFWKMFRGAAVFVWISDGHDDEFV